MNFDQLSKPLRVMPTRPLYKWAKIFNRLQRGFFAEEVKLRREKQIEDFVYLNGFQKVYFVTDTDVFRDTVGASISAVDSPEAADIVVITDQKFSRYPCPEIIKQIQKILERCPCIYLCLNRHYINLDNSYIDENLDSNFCRAITQWMVQKLSPKARVVDLSLNYIDYGENFTWAIPDRHYYITHETNRTI